MVHSIDENVGRLLAKLDELNIAANTLVVFTSDNGGLSVREVPAFAKHTPPTDNGPLRAGKGYLYEGGIREPFIIRWPGKVGKGQVIDEPVIAQDLYNTFVVITETGTGTDDGVSLMPLFEGKSLVPRGLLWHMPHYSPQHGKPASAYREGAWKVIHFYEDDSWQLYHLGNDVVEANDLADRAPEKLQEMKEKLEAALQSKGANFPTPNPAYEGE
jgi:arylsulfatase A-like enzyme